MSQTANVPDQGVKTTDIALPPLSVSFSQDREWCVVQLDGQWKKIRLHDYDKIYAIPGLYETLFYEVLKCKSPSKIRQMLDRCLGEARVSPDDLRVLDLGAGNGMVGEQLMDIGVRSIVGVDIIPAAAEAARRDREEVYDEYLVLDMTDLSDGEVPRLAKVGFNCLTCVAALGFGDIPPAAFSNAYNLVESGGWVAFNIKSEFLEAADPCGFAGLIRRMIGEGLIDVREKQQYPHRLATTGEPIPYTAFVAVKNQDVPASWAV